MNASSTQVSLVAAGPGDPGLLTVCAVGLLHDADVVVTDPECEPIARAHARFDAQILVAVDDDGNVADHADRVQLVIEPALEGRRVVRLMAGDPVLDGSLALEAGALAREGITYDIAPGVSTVTGSAAYAGFSLTGGRAREVRVVDAHDPEVDWPSLADPHATVVVLDGAERALDICRVLTIAGRDPRTPVAITRNCTTVDQRSILTTLGEVSGAVKAAKGQVGPGVLVIGEVVSQCAQLVVVRDQAAVRLAGAGAAHQGAGRRAVRAAAPLRRRAGRGADDLRRAAAHPAADGARRQGPGRPAATSGSRSPRPTRCGPCGRSSTSTAWTPARSPASRSPPSASRPPTLLRSFGITPDLVPARRAVHRRACSRSGRSTTTRFDPINRVFLPRADIATETLVAGLTELRLGGRRRHRLPDRARRTRRPRRSARRSRPAGSTRCCSPRRAPCATSSASRASRTPRRSSPCIGPKTAKTAEEHGLRVDVLPETAVGRGRWSTRSPRTASALRAAARWSTGEIGWRPSRRARCARVAGPPEAWVPGGAPPAAAPHAGAASAGRPRPGCTRPSSCCRCSSREGLDRAAADLVDARRRAAHPRLAARRPPRRPHARGRRRHAVRRARRTRTPSAPGPTDPDGILNVARARRGRRGRRRDSWCMADLCLDEFTDHGHCGVLDGRRARSTTTPPSSATPRWRVAQADAGAHVVGPSGMMDGQVGAVRDGARRRRLRRRRDPRLRREVRLGVLRPVPRGGRLARSTATAAPTSRTRPTGREALREVRARRRRGRRHRHGQAGRAYLDVRAPRSPTSSTCRSRPTRSPASTR